MANRVQKQFVMLFPPCIDKLLKKINTQLFYQFEFQNHCAIILFCISDTDSY